MFLDTVIHRSFEIQDHSHLHRILMLADSGLAHERVGIRFDDRGFQCAAHIGKVDNQTIVADQEDPRLDDRAVGFDAHIHKRPLRDDLDRGNPGLRRRRRWCDLDRRRRLGKGHFLGDRRFGHHFDRPWFRKIDRQEGSIFFMMNQIVGGTGQHEAESRRSSRIAGLLRDDFFDRIESHLARGGEHPEVGSGEIDDELKRFFEFKRRVIERAASPQRDPRGVGQISHDHVGDRDPGRDLRVRRLDLGRLRRAADQHDGAQDSQEHLRLHSRPSSRVRNSRTISRVLVSPKKSTYRSNTVRSFAVIRFTTPRFGPTRVPTLTAYPFPSGISIIP